MFNPLVKTTGGKRSKEGEGGWFSPLRGIPASLGASLLGRGNPPSPRIMRLIGAEAKKGQDCIRCGNGSARHCGSECQSSCSERKSASLIRGWSNGVNDSGNQKKWGQLVSQRKRQTQRTHLKNHKISTIWVQGKPEIVSQRSRVADVRRRDISGLSTNRNYLDKGKQKEKEVVESFNP